MVNIIIYKLSRYINMINDLLPSKQTLSDIKAMFLEGLPQVVLKFLFCWRHQLNHFQNKFAYMPHRINKLPQRQRRNIVIYISWSFDPNKLPPSPVILSSCKMNGEVFKVTTLVISMTGGVYNSSDICSEIWKIFSLYTNRLQND